MGSVRPVRVYLAAFLALSVMAGCSGGTSGEPEDTRVETSAALTQDSTETTQPDSPAADEAGRLINAGSEPRIALEITDDARTNIVVEAAKDSATTINGSSQTESATASYRLEMNLVVSGSTARLSIIPTVTSMESGDPDFDAVDLGTWVWRLANSGELLSFDNNDLSEQFGADTVALLSTPDLVLVTPGVPVGVGAQWSYLVGSGDEMLGVITLTDITESDLHITFEVSVDLGGGFLTIAGSGTYDRASLLVRDVGVDTTLSYSSQVSANGEFVELVGSQHISHSYTEAGS